MVSGLRTTILISRLAITYAGTVYLYGRLGDSF